MRLPIRFFGGLTVRTHSIDELSQFVHVEKPCSRRGSRSHLTLRKRQALQATHSLRLPLADVEDSAGPIVVASGVDQ